MKSPAPHEVPERVLTEFEVDAASLERVGSGHINQTWAASGAVGRCIVQAVNPVFSPEIHHNIDAVTRHLERKGLVTPRLCPTREGALWLEHEGRAWRVLTRIEGHTHEAPRNERQVREAGRVLGHFHAALADLEHAFRHTRLDVHNTALHLATLREALETHRNHSEHAAVAGLAAGILEIAATLDDLPDSPARTVHGDPKISNVLFEPDADVALCLIDLDTLAQMPVALELGDAFRSWCNVAAEDAPASGFSVAGFEAAIGGYREGAPELLDRDEIEALPAATLRIAVELAARFCTDALAESYFGWDRARYPTASAHNQARAAAQLALARSIAAAGSEMRAAMARVFGNP